MKINLSHKNIIVLTGPESSGKSTLADLIATQYDLPLVKEFAREFLNLHGPSYVESDLKTIAKCQNIQEADAHNKYGLIVCDTDFITVDIWSIEKFGRPVFGNNQFENQKLYLLCTPDIPWEADPQRENPTDRDRLFEVYKEYMEENNLDYQVVTQKVRSEGVQVQIV